ncbi:MAG: hypothetical protein LC778_08480 [Acidobacteria bacterium]|nr:hypothetical protein [Acidobacteriota bacterium]
MNQKRLQLALTFLRIVVALLMFVHGVARIYLGIVDDFGARRAKVFDCPNFEPGFNRKRQTAGCA